MVLVSSIISSGMSNRSARESDPAGRLSDFVMSSARRRALGSRRSQRPNPVTGPAKVVGSSIGRLARHHMMSGDVCNGLDPVRRPYNSRCDHESGKKVVSEDLRAHARQ